MVQVCTLGLSACSGRAGGPTRKQGPDAAAERRADLQRPGVLRVQVDHLPAQLNPYVSQDLWCQTITVPSVFEPLVLMTPSGAPKPHLASTMEVRNGGLLYLFRLRPAVQFHDGRPLTSTDVKFTLDRLLARNSPAELLRAELGDVEEVRAPDPERVEIALRRPNYLLPSILAEVGILPAHIYGRFGLRNPKLNWMPIGTGPLRVVERRSRDTVVLEAHDKYWGERTRLSRVIFLAIPDPARALAALRNGELDILSHLYPGYYPDQLSSSRMKEHFRVLRLHPYRMRLMVYNMRHPILKDRRVRLALERLADRERMVRTLRNGLGQVLTAPLWPLSQWYDGTIHPHSFDRAGAVRLLDAAGWQDRKGTGRRQRLGRVLRLRILRARESAEMGEAAQMLKTDFRAVGIEAEVEVADFGFLKAQMRRGHFDVALLGLAPRIDSDLSPWLHTRGELNHAGGSNVVVDALLDSLRQAPSAEERQRLGQRLHRLLYEDFPFTVLYAPIELMVVDRRVHGLANNGRWPRLAGLFVGGGD
jgi:peptide/nickel transport system substrate-binding protein